MTTDLSGLAGTVVTIARHIRDEYPASAEVLEFLSRELAATTNTTRVQVGERVTMKVGYSEAACHLRVAGETMLVELLQNQFGACMAQLWHPADLPGQTPSRFSFPVTPGEAGLYHDAEGWYHYA